MADAPVSVSTLIGAWETIACESGDAIDIDQVSDIDFSSPTAHGSIEDSRLASLDSMSTSDMNGASTCTIACGKGMGRDMSMSMSAMTETAPESNGEGTASPGRVATPGAQASVAREDTASSGRVATPGAQGSVARARVNCTEERTDSGSGAVEVVVALGEPAPVPGKLSTIPNQESHKSLSSIEPTTRALSLTVLACSIGIGWTLPKAMRTRSGRCSTSTTMTTHARTSRSPRMALILSSNRQSLMGTWQDAKR